MLGNHGADYLGRGKGVDLDVDEGCPEVSLVFVPMLTNRALAKALLAWLKAWCLSTASLYLATIAAAALSAWAAGAAQVGRALMSRGSPLARTSAKLVTLPGYSAHTSSVVTRVKAPEI